MPMLSPAPGVGSLAETKKLTRNGPAMEPAAPWFVTVNEIGTVPPAPQVAGIVTAVVARSASEIVTCDRAVRALSARLGSGTAPSVSATTETKYVPADVLAGTVATVVGDALAPPASETTT